MSDLYAPDPEGHLADQLQQQNPDCIHSDPAIFHNGTMACVDCHTVFTYPTGIHTPRGADR